VGRDFERVARDYFLTEQGLTLYENFSVEVGVGDMKRPHSFDLGATEPATLVECKSHRWAETGKVPSAKMTVWNESMYYFHLAPAHYRKFFFVLRDVRGGKGDSLAQHYVRHHSHLIPALVSIIEFDEVSHSAVAVKVG
jgi:hypothetical protein